MKSSFLRSLMASTLLGLLSLAASQAAPPISFAGGDGSSPEKAVAIKGGNEETGVQAEDVYLDQHFPGYKKKQQALLSKGKRRYDRIDFTTAHGEKKAVFFDITGFFGKM